MEGYDLTSSSRSYGEIAVLVIEISIVCCTYGPVGTTIVSAAVDAHVDEIASIVAHIVSSDDVAAGSSVVAVVHDHYLSEGADIGIYLYNSIGKIAYLSQRSKVSLVGHPEISDVGISGI